MRFSERQGLKPLKSAVQTATVDDDLRNALWSVLKVFYWDTVKGNGNPIYPGAYLSVNNDELGSLFKALWLDFFKLPLDTIPDEWNDAYQGIRKYFFSCKWFEVYDFLEFVVQNYPGQQRNDFFVTSANSFLERELSAYRFVNGKVARVVAPEEIQAIESAVAASPDPVRAHLDQAMRLLSDRRKPDYRNSIKESISAVEALVRMVTTSQQGTLGELMKRLRDKHPIHPALESAFMKLYGYTSDASGIRHALIDKSDTTFEEAKFMIVVCSAFVNYVIGHMKT